MEKEVPQRLVHKVGVRKGDLAASLLFGSPGGTSVFERSELGVALVSKLTGFVS